MKKLLILGNGFDLASGLPTKYEHFLKFMKEARKEFESYGFNIESLHDKIPQFKLLTSYEELCKKADVLTNLSEAKPLRAVCVAYRHILWQFLYERKHSDPLLPLDESFFQYISGNDNFSEYNACMLHIFVYGNLWLDYFAYRNNINLGRNWIDFENEICKVVERAESLLIHKQAKSDIEQQNLCPPPLIPAIQEFMGPMCKRKHLIRTFLPVFLSEMRILARCLEVYMYLMNHLTCDVIRKLDDIDNVGDIDWLLSFNYTSTFLQNYGAGMNLSSKSGCMDFIHGRAGMKNVILGIQESLDNKDKNTVLDCIDFKKYFQRIFFKTGLNYKQWIPNVKIDHNDTDVYVFGHSLDESDGEVFRYVILNPNVRKTIIYYYSDGDYRSKILNLIKTIGKDELIQRTGVGNIVFSVQTE